MTSPTQYFGFWLWPVLNDETGHVDYWDVHHPNDDRGQGHPVAEGCSTKAEAKAWVKQRRHEDATIRLFDRLKL